MPEGDASSGSKATGFTEIRDGDGNLLVAFNSDDVKDYWGNEYQKQRIRFCMRHRRDNIPMYFRTGMPPSLFLWGAIELRLKNLLRR